MEFAEQPYTDERSFSERVEVDLKVSFLSPEHLREKGREWHPEIIEFVLNYRKLHPRLGKEKLKPIVDKFCLERGLRPVSVSTIGRIIRYLKERGLLRGEARRKLSYYARSGKFYEKEKRRVKRKETYT